MPVVIVEISNERTVDQKRKLVKAITQAMIDCANCKPDNLHVTIHENKKENWGKAGVLSIDDKEEVKSFVLVELWKGRTVDQKRKLVKAITQAMIDCANCKPDHLHVGIHESTKDNWGREGIISIDAVEEKK
jgi:4-oxalocrotonate tautomerase